MRMFLAVAIILAALLSNASAINILEFPQTLPVLATGAGAAPATSAQATFNGSGVRLTTASLTQAAGANYNLTFNNAQIESNSIVLVQLTLGTNSQGTPVLTKVTPGTGSVTIVVTNQHATLALNGTLLLDVVVFN
jgi:hypothetical protein